LDLKKYTKKEDDAKFHILYNFKDAYGLQDMTVKGGMTYFMNKLKSDNATQIKYTHYRSGGIEAGSAGKEAFCDTSTSPQYESQCYGGSFKKSSF
jgi:hypothetical protein